MPGKNWVRADESEVEGAAGELVDLPADGHGLHLDGDDAEKSRGLVEPEVGDNERRRGSRRWNAVMGRILQVEQFLHPALAGAGFHRIQEALSAARRRRGPS